MNKFLIFGGLGIAGFLVYKSFTKNSGMNKPANTPSTGSPRLDNANQPWYNGITSWAKSTADTYEKNPTAALQASTSVIHSLSDISGTISGWFGGSSDGNSGPAADLSNDQSGDQQGSADDYNWNLGVLPASDVQQSNIFGVSTFDDSQLLPDPSSVIMADSSDYGMIDSNTSDGDFIGSDNVA